MINTDKSRNKEIVFMRVEQNKSLQEIGDTFNITRERVRQILLKQSIKPFRYNLSKQITVNCSFCGKEKQMKECLYLSHIKKHKNFYCDSKCYATSIKKYSSSKEKNRILMKKYYNKHKNEQWFKDKIREYNHRAVLKRKEKLSNMS